MPASKPVPREADGTVDIKQARKRMPGTPDGCGDRGEGKARGAREGAETHHGA